MSDVFRPTKIALAIILLLVLGGFCLSLVNQRWHVGPQLAAALEGATPDAEFRVRVAFPFKPESFHLSYLQRYGIIAGADDMSVTLRRVSGDAAREVAGQYWVSGVEFVQ